MAALDEGVLSSVINSNFKTLAEAVAVNAAANQNLQLQDATSHRNRLNGLFEASLGQMLNRMNSMDIEEAVSVGKVTSSDLPAKMSELGSVLAALQSQMGSIVATLQQLMKGAQTTLPETGRE